MEKFRKSALEHYFVPGVLIYICGASYSRLEHVKAHIARIHTKDFKNRCQYCNKGFISINELRDHERIHTNERPFECNIPECLKTYRTKSALRNHLIRHTNYYYPCKYCFKKFRNMNNLVNHSKKLHAESFKSDDELDFVLGIIMNEPSIKENLVTIDD